MQASFVAELGARRHAIKSAWERKLRSEPITSPLANPDTLVLLLDRTLDELLQNLTAAAMRPTDGRKAPRGPLGGCLCGLNPLLAYYRVGASVLSSYCSLGGLNCPDLPPATFSSCVQEMLCALQCIAQREIRSFCAMCQTEIARAGRSSHCAVHGVAAHGAGR